MRKIKGLMARYEFAKKIYPNRLIIFKTKNGYKSIGKDQVLLDYIIINKLLFKLKDLKINFVLIDNMDIIDEGCFDDDNYYRYVKISMLNKILFNIKSMI